MGREESAWTTGVLFLLTWVAAQEVLFNLIATTYTEG
jgi:hypothetical protein